MTDNEINEIKFGDKLIFHRFGGVLSARIGNVFTFSNWYDNNGKDSPSKYFWQCVELKEAGNNQHNFSIFDVEKFDKDKHVDHQIMTTQILNQERRKFLDEFGE